MATVNFLYRSTRQTANLVARLLFTHNEKNVVLGANTEYKVDADYWNANHVPDKKTKKIKGTKDVDIINKRAKVNTELKKINDHILTSFDLVNPENITKDWLQTTIDYYYNPPIEAKAEQIPTELIKYFDIYINKTKPPLKPNTKKKCNVIKKMVIGFEKYENIVLDLKDVNPDFQDRFENYCAVEKYAPNTVATALKFIRTICNNASYKGLEVSTRLKGITITNTKVESIYLSFEELEQINKTILSDSLNNAKDWLIISCYTSQRVSDFMRFDKSMIRTEKGVQLIEFTQQKTNKVMTLPLHRKVVEILEKRNGDFPYRLSDQKYNEHIKKVCQIAGLTKKVKGSKKLETAEGSGIYRKETKVFEKWELATSHIGRRSFCSNFYGILDNTDIMYISGHSTEELLNIYLGKSNKSKALKIANLDAFN
jgi:integrase